MGAVYYTKGRIFDGIDLHQGWSLLTEDGRIVAIGADVDCPPDAEIVDLDGDILSPGFVDLQVNGGGGLQFNDAPTVETLRVMAAAHRRLGCAAILPTLITDTPDKTRAAIDAVGQAVAEGVPGIAGLHLEGPHLAVARKGAHDGALIRPMDQNDLSQLCAAARTLPCLMLTVAPESVSLAQVRALADAGAVVSLGHSDCDYDTAMAYADAGARCVTHLFNAMSPITGRAPGLVGAALDHGGLSAGLIADAIHVHPATMRRALAAKAGPSQVFLVSDCMAPAGSDLEQFELGCRTVLRRDGALRLADGTLAGADLELCHAISVMTRDVGLPMQNALRMASSVPADLIGLNEGHLIVDEATVLVRLREKVGAMMLTRVFSCS